MSAGNGRSSRIETFENATDGGDIVPLSKINILESFFYVDADITRSIPNLNSFMLDSGAFTFFSSGKSVDWDGYVERYAEYIVANDIRLFFELDIDPLIGHPRVLAIRDKLERLTSRRCIPVWHKSRGKQDFVDMCREYPYVAIGGIVSGEITRAQYRYFPFFIDTAHEHGAKIHGLGFTNLDGLTRYHFDSVDSTAWVSGNRFGAVYRFDGRTMTKVTKPEGMRMGNTKMLAVNNFNEWAKFSIYARKYL